MNNLALGSRSGEAQLHADAQGSGLSSLSRRRLDHFNLNFNLSERDTVRTLDDYCREQRLEHIDFQKLDVECHELDALQAGMRPFQACRLAMVSFEFGGANIDSRMFFRDCWYFFRENGPWRIHRLTPSGRLMPIPAYHEDYEQFRTTNFLAILQPK